MLDNNNRTKEIVVDGDNLYQIHDNGNIYQFTGTPMTGWRQLDNNPYSDRLVAANGELYQLHSTNAIWKYTGTPFTGWELIDNQRLPATKLVATRGIVAKSDGSQRVKQYTGVPLATWTELFYEDYGTFGLCAADGELYTSTRSFVWKYTGTPGKWQFLLNHAGVDKIACYGKDVYAYTRGASVYKWTGVPGKWDLIDNSGLTTSITAGARGFYQIQKSGAIFQFTPNGWKQIDGNPASKAIVAGNLIHQVHSDGKIWRYLN